VATTDDADDDAVEIDAGSLPKVRLDRALAEALASVASPPSRATLRRWIEAGRVSVGGRALRDPSAVAPSRGAVRIEPEAPPPSAIEPDASVEVSIVFEDAHLVVVDKPAGMVVHPSRGHARGSLVQGLLARPGWPRVAPGPDDPNGFARPGVVHRIDRGTSGLVVVAKTAMAREALKELFSRHAIDRAYLAVAVGSPRDATLDTLHGRHPTDRLRMTSTPRGPARRAVTHVQVIERFGGAALVSCRLETGRTHQIRVHLTEALGCPLLGDPLYGRAPARGLLAELHRELGRQALHAARLGFVHPITAVPHAWESPLPADLERAIARLRAGS
jgi:23S rRNA pseudouridine1911/1915/1917 synthase